jgi:signal transduction histidine kinase/ActR/RegA family two-component response regulator
MRSLDLHVVPGGASSDAAAASSAPAVVEPGHSVQFYENDAFLAAAVADFVADGLRDGQAVIVIAVAAHRQAFVRRLRARGIDPERARSQGTLTWCDADVLLARIVVDGEVDAHRFRAEVMPLLQRAELRSPGGVTRAYGELVDVLWRRGDREAALRVEELWNELARTHRFALLCGYAMGPFCGTTGSVGYEAVCATHTHIVPGPQPRRTSEMLPHPDQASAAADDEETTEALRRRVRALSSEVAHRRLLERELREALLERSQVEEELQRSRQLLLEAERVARLGSWSACPALDTCDWSDELWHMLGAVPHSLKPSLEAFVAHVHPGDRPRLRAVLDRTLRAAEAPLGGMGTTPVRLDVRIVDDGGHSRVCDLRIDTSQHGRRDPLVLHGTLLDVTEQRAGEAERRALDSRLLETQRLESVGVLAGGIAHDFNNLLTSIVGNADLLQSSLPPDGEERVLVDEVLLAARRSADLTRQLLAYAGHAAFVVRPLDLAALAGEVGALLRTAMPAGATLRLDLGDAPAHVAGDRAQLTQVLMNLVINAADALPGDGGVVAVRVRELTLNLEEATVIALRSVPGSAAPPMGPCIRVEVTDTGVGMTDEIRARMFEPFFSTKGAGHGLGLAATLGILRAHRAAVEVVSAPGRGTTVRTWIPGVSAAETDVIAGPPTADATAPRRHILVVDDEEPVRNTLTRLLRHLGYAVSVASGAREALTLVGAGAPAPDLAIVDLTMPDLGGEATAELLGIRWPDLPVIFTSGYGDSEQEGSVDPMHRAMLAKPFDVAAVRRQVAAALREEREPTRNG